MAKGTNCSICKNYKIGSKGCAVYPEQIPTNIFIEKVICKSYEKAVADDEKDLPIAKGK